MKIHLKQIPELGMHIEGEEDAAFLDAPDYKPLSPLRYSLDVGLSGGGLFATGRLAVGLETQCVSCLERFRVPLQLDDFSMQTELTGAELVDLTPQVREDILLALSPYPHCDRQGGQVCKGTARTEREPDAGESHTWDELDKLKLKRK